MLTAVIMMEVVILRTILDVMMATVMNMRMDVMATVIALVFVEHTDADPARRNQLFDPGYVILRPSFERNEQNFAIEANTPMKISRMITELDGIADRAWFEAQPALRGGPHHDCTIGIHQQNSAVEQFLLAWQSNRKLLTSPRGDQQTPARDVRHWNVDDIDSAAMLEIMYIFEERRLKAAAEDTIDTQHRNTTSSSSRTLLPHRSILRFIREPHRPVTCR
jgi:hypothetical protein